MDLPLVSVLLLPTKFHTNVSDMTFACQIRVFSAPYFINQRLAKAPKTLGCTALPDAFSVKIVTDEQLMHRLLRFSGIIAPPYDRVRKPS